MPENRNWKGRVSVNVILIMSAFWVIYVPWLLFDRIAVHTATNIGTGLLCIILLALAMPSIVFTFFIDKKYRNILKNE